MSAHWVDSSLFGTHVLSLLGKKNPTFPPPPWLQSTRNLPCSVFLNSSYLCRQKRGYVLWKLFRENVWRTTHSTLYTICIVHRACVIIFRVLFIPTHSEDLYIFFRLSKNLFIWHLTVLFQQQRIPKSFINFQTWVRPGMEYLQLFFFFFPHFPELWKDEFRNKACWLLLYQQTIHHFPTCAVHLNTSLMVI